MTCRVCGRQSTLCVCAACRPRGRVLWLSRHAPTPGQVDELQRLYPGADIERDASVWGDAREIAKRIAAAHYLDTVIVAPLSVIAVLADQGARLLWAECAPESVAGRVEFRGARGQGYRHVRFRRIVRVTMELADL